MRRQVRRQVRPGEEYWSRRCWAKWERERRAFDLRAGCKVDDCERSDLSNKSTTRLLAMALPQLQGTLFKYSNKSSCNVAFRYGSIENKKHAIVIGGLTDGLFACSYVSSLSNVLDQRGVSVVQTLLSSSYYQYGISSLDMDARELTDLAAYLRSEFGGTDYCLIGHSTGCQDCVRYCLRNSENKPSCVVLQAPVSDRESLDLHGSTYRNLQKAQDMATKGEENELMPISTQEDGAPITAKRYLSLASKYGDDDMFSSDFTDEELKKLLSHMSPTPTLVLQSGSDEYIPKSVDPELNAARLAKAMGSNAEHYTIPGGSHALENHTKEAVELISNFVCKHL